MIMLNAILTSLGMGISNRLNWSHMHNFSRILQSTKHLLQNYLVSLNFSRLLPLPRVGETVEIQATTSSVL